MTAEDKADNAGIGSGSAAEKPDGSTVISVKAKPDSDGEKLSDSAASEKRSDISSDTPNRAEADKTDASAAVSNDCEEKKTSQFGMESLWSDTSK